LPELIGWHRSASENRLTRILDPGAAEGDSRRLGISPDQVRTLERRALAALAESREFEALRPAA
jgi:hypothetical protein